MRRDFLGYRPLSFVRGFAKHGIRFDERYELRAGDRSDVSVPGAQFEWVTSAGRGSER